MPEKNNKNTKSIGIFFVYLVMGILIFVAVSNIMSNNDVNEINYTDFIKEINENRIIRISIQENGQIDFKTLEGYNYKVYAPVFYRNNELIDKLASEGIIINFEKGLSSSWWASLLSYILPLLFFIFIWIFILRIMRGGAAGQGMNFSKSTAKKYDVSKQKVSFDDVAGIDESKEELVDIVNYLKNPKSFNVLGARMPKGILLVGQPGTGKTLVARAVAGEAGVPFFYISGSDFVELFVGVGASRVRDLFNKAKTESPSIIFVDELDAVGRQRGAGLGGGHDEREQTLNQLLVEMDGFEPNSGVIIMAATNRPDILDKALLRPGRFDKKITVDTPDLKGREEILKIHFKGKKIDKNIDIEKLAKSTPGFVGADLENLINEAALITLRNKNEFIKQDDCEEAIERILAGPQRRSKIISEKEKKIIAYHELGHAVIGHILPNTDPVHKVTIVPRGHAALGYTMQIPKEDKYLISKSEMIDKIKNLLAGRVAEQIVFNDITTGAGNDLKRATELAKKMVYQLGMSEKIGPVSWGYEEGDVFLGRELTRQKNFSEETASELDSEVKKILINAYNETEKIINQYLSKIHLIAKYLISKETISGEELESMLELDDLELESRIFEKLK